MIRNLLASRSPNVISVAKGMTVAEALALLTEHRIGAVPVIDDGTAVGILSERDIVRHLHSDGAEIVTWPVERVMTAPVVTVASDTSFLSALGLMTQRRIRHLPVVDEQDRMIGFISIGDLVKARIDGIEAEAAALREYIQSA